MGLYLLSLSFGFFNESLHDFRMLAGVYGEHSTIKEGRMFFSNSLILIFRVNILKNFFRGERFAIEVVSLDPHPWSVIVFII